MKEKNYNIIITGEDDKFQYANASKIINIHDLVLIRTLEAFQYTFCDMSEETQEKLNEFLDYLHENVEFMAYCPDNWDYLEDEFEETVYLQRKLKYKDI